MVPVTGIFLHRIADTCPNGWTMPTAKFDRLLDWLEANVDLVSLDDAQELLRCGNRGRVAVHISFDDGYADNCLHAIPELLKRRIPFTYYVTTENVRSGKPFPHDVQRHEPLAPNSVDQIQAMHDAGVEIGVHTRTHPDVSKLRTLGELTREIRGAREDLAEWLGTVPNHFAFPFGLAHNVTPRAIQFLHDERFHSYSTASGGYNFPLDGSFHLRRFHGDPILDRIFNWLSFDPRWIYGAGDPEYIPYHRSGQRREVTLTT